MKDHQREVTTTGVPPWKSPVALSVTLHVLILGIALAGWTWTSPDHEPPPRSISARLITQQEPEPSPVVEPADQQQLDEERRAEEQRRQEEAERRRQEEEKQRLAEQQRQEEQKKLQQQMKRKEKEQREAKAREREAEIAREEEAARQKAEAEAKERARQKAEEEKRRQEAQRKREEAERKRQEELARQEAERKLREQQLEAQAESARQARAEEARRQRETAAAKARDARMLSESEKYQQLIRERLSQAWYPPSSATEEMTARLQITLLPTGELAGVKLVRSSGNTAFDNSALGAVRALSRYPIPDNRDTFERYFRQFMIEFNPRRLR